MSPLRQLLSLPEEVTKSAFVVRLGEAVHRPDVLMDTYAVTRDIHHALDRGLGLIKAALDEKRNVAAFVHGSFGSGKSHYMAALSLLAGNHPRPWAEPALHDLLAKHEWVKGAKLVRIHLNLIDAPSLGDKLWGAYLEATRAAHPEAVLAPLFADEGLFANADRLRSKLGDETFFAELGKGGAVDSRWGKKAGDPWGAARYDRARTSQDPKERAALFSALVGSYFPAFTQQASAYLPFEQALAAMTHHARGLGYDAVVFFLDELVLLLAQKAADPEALDQTSHRRPEPRAAHPNRGPSRRPAAPVAGRPPGHERCSSSLVSRRSPGVSLTASATARTGTFGKSTALPPRGRAASSTTCATDWRASSRPSSSIQRRARSTRAGLRSSRSLRG